MAIAMRMAGNEVGKGGKAMAMGTKVVGKRTATATKGRWQWQQGWWASDGNCNKEGDGDGDSKKGGAMAARALATRVKGRRQQGGQ